MVVSLFRAAKRSGAKCGVVLQGTALPLLQRIVPRFALRNRKPSRESFPFPGFRESARLASRRRLPRGSSTQEGRILTLLPNRGDGQSRAGVSPPIKTWPPGLGSMELASRTWRLKAAGETPALLYWPHTFAEPSRGVRSGIKMRPPRRTAKETSGKEGGRSLSLGLEAGTPADETKGKRR